MSNTKPVRSKRNLTDSEENLLLKLFNSYSDDPAIVAEQAKLLRISNDNKLVDSIFERLEKDFTGSSTLRLPAIDLIYKIQDKVLLKKFEDHNIGLLKKKNQDKIYTAVIDIFYSKDRILIKKAMAALKDSVAVIELLRNLPKDFLDLAIDQFSKPKYNYLPLLELLDKDYLSEDQISTIINSITKDGLDKRNDICTVAYTEVHYKIVARFVKKISDVGWDSWKKVAPTMQMSLLIPFLINLDDIEEKKSLLLKNREYKYLGEPKVSNLEYFSNLVYFFCLVTQIKEESILDRLDFYRFALK